jgi:hypothetical protein
MANTIRSAKDGKDWTSNELLAYNITVPSQSPDAECFYPQVESLSLDPNLLSGTLNTRKLSDSTLHLLYSMELVSRQKWQVSLML